MKIGVIYAVTTPELVSTIEQQLKKQLGDDAILTSYVDSTILAEVRDNGYVTNGAAARLVELYMRAVKDGVDVLMHSCSSLGDVCYASQNLFKYLGIPLVSIDEEMAREAVRSGKRIGVMATLATTFEPTKALIRRCAREMGKRIELVDILVENAFGLDQETFKSRLLEAAGKNVGNVDVIILAQGSMAYCEEVIADAYKKVVLSSPRFGALAVKEAARMKGLIK